MLASYPAPIGGWVTNENMAAQRPQTARVLTNFWPTPRGIEPRGGAELRCFAGGQVLSLFQYQGNGTPVFFAATQTEIFEFDQMTASQSTLVATLTGRTSGFYSDVEMRTDAGTFLNIYNGTDTPQQYDGTSWSSLSITATGLNSSDLIYGWVYQNRQFLIEKNSLSVWYLGVNSVSGTATEFPVTGLFKKGGSLLFGATWSGDSGEGYDDRCVFVTDKGEAAVYTGTNPAIASTWALQGVYDIGEPLGPRAHTSVGGDLIIATKTGLIPMSAVVQKGVEQMKLYALSRPIDDEWAREVRLSAQNETWRLEKWESRNMLLVNPTDMTGSQDFTFVANAETSAWAKFTGWQAGEMRVLGNGLYYGDSEGRIFQCDVGGTDNGDGFVCTAIFRPDDMGAPEQFKVAKVMRGTWRYKTAINPQHFVLADFDETPPAPIAAAPVTGSSSWDTAVWDVASWGTGSSTFSVLSDWESATGAGHVLAFGVQVESGSSTKLNAVFVHGALSYEVGGLVV